MKYIKLFESFDSSKLSKTLGYVNKDSRKLLLKHLRSMTDELDVPFSKISDEFIEYLPFYKAYNKILPNKSLLKFWFDINGNYIQPTVNVSGREIKKIIRIKSENVKHLDKVHYNLIGDGYVFFGDDDYIYFIHNNENFKTPESGVIKGDEWKSYGKYSTIIGGEGKINVKLYKFKKIPSNTAAYFYDSEMKMGHALSESELEKAHFALVLNLSDLKESLTPLSKIRSDREELKKGIGLTDDEIRTANINRYLNKLSDNLNFELGDLNDINKAVLKICGGEYILFHIYDSVPIELTSLSFNIYGLISGMYTSPNVIKSSYKRGYEDARKKNGIIINNINKLNSNAEFFTIDLIEKTINVSKQLYKKVKDFGNITNIEDLDALKFKLNSISDFIRNNRYGLSISYVRLFSIDDKYWKYIMGLEDYELIQKALSDLDVISNFIKRI